MLSAGSFAALAREEGARRIAVGRDGRTHSGMLEAALVRGLTEGGITAVLIGQGPSPMLYFSTYHLDVDGGIQVTGSHNPADYNGFKMLLKGRSVFGQEIQALGKRSAGGHWMRPFVERHVALDANAIDHAANHRAVRGGGDHDVSFGRESGLGLGEWRARVDLEGDEPLLAGLQTFALL